jgi:hypothetical protein
MPLEPAAYSRKSGALPRRFGTERLKVTSPDTVLLTALRQDRLPGRIDIGPGVELDAFCGS